MSVGEFYTVTIDDEENETACVKIVECNGQLFAEHGHGGRVNARCYNLRRQASKKAIDAWYWARYDQYRRLRDRARKEATDYSAKAESAYNEYIERMVDE